MDHCKATKEKRVHGRPGKEIWRKKCGQWVLGTAERRWRQQHKTELNGDKWSSLGAQRRKSRRAVM